VIVHVEMVDDLIRGDGDDGEDMVRRTLGEHLV